jgi:hypothetical protein
MIFTNLLHDEWNEGGENIYNIDFTLSDNEEDLNNQGDQSLDLLSQRK